jgi:hypothetical protein
MNTHSTSLQRHLTAAIAVACTLASVTLAAHAEEQWNPHLHRPAPEERWREDRVVPDRAFDMHREQPPLRRDAVRVGPPRGTVVDRLPSQTIVVQHAGISYSIHDGVWYRPDGARFTVVAPPIGAFVPVLPSFYTTVWFGGLPYYYADDVYYAWRPDHTAYEIVAAPAGAPEPVVNGDRLYAYPLNGQTPEQQARDRYDCHVWATDQSGVDPSRTMTTAQSADYDRAMTACLSGRGYSVK